MKSAKTVTTAKVGPNARTQSKILQELPHLELPAGGKVQSGKTAAKPSGKKTEAQYPVGVVIRQTHLAFKNALHQRLRANGLTSAQWVFLRILWNQDGLNQKELSERVGVHPTTAVPAITILERNGYVRRERNEQDKRNVTVRLTDEGKLLARQLIPVALEQNKKALDGISREDADKLMQMLLIIQRNLGELSETDDLVAPLANR